LDTGRFEVHVMHRHTSIGLTILALILSSAATGLASAAETEGVQTGLDVLVQDNFGALAGRNVGLITNHTAIDQHGKWIGDLFSKAPNVKVVAMFSPEHGLKGQLDEHVGDTTDPLTGVKVYSLYGKTRKPSKEMLAGVDTLVFDIQDIGARFYTYIATLGMCMEAAAENKVRFVVLDRPNPITGTRVFGPYNDREGEFTAYHRIPVVHGMTVGELASMYNTERKIGCDLQVIKMHGWKRSMWFDETLLSWVHPSPNMRSLTEATLYPAVCLLEATNVSVGRGTDTPFELFGAPWIDERGLAARLNGLHLAGVRFVPYRFTPTSSVHKDKPCGGVQIILTDRNAFDPLECGLSLAWALKAQHGSEFKVDGVNNLLFNKSVLEKLKAATDAPRFTPMWEDDLKAFQAVRSKYLAYE
jgi:uncharacterized protein YbbC (DUF1343 family)